MSINKARVVLAQNPDAMVLGFDTSFVYNQQLFGKPKDKHDAVRMLMMLSDTTQSDTTHRVLTSVALRKGDEIHYQLSDNKINFRPISQQEA